MKKILQFSYWCLFMFFVSMVVWSCASPSGDPSVEEIEKIEKGGGKGKLANGKMPTESLVDLRTLRVQRDVNRNRIYYKGDDVYTGDAVQAAKGKGVTSYMEYTITDGIMESMRGYFGNGKKERDFSFKDGKAHGKLEIYYKNGQKQVEEYYDMGDLDGQQRRWYENGQLWMDSVYEKGVKKSEKVYNKAGELLD